ncbi:hypothetical protein ACJJTC_006490 [Scirpophaga incertulas]
MSCSNALRNNKRFTSEFRPITGSAGQIRPISASRAVTLFDENTQLAPVSCRDVVRNGTHRTCVGLPLKRKFKAQKLRSTDPVICISFRSRLSRNVARKKRALSTKYR